MPITGFLPGTCDEVVPHDPVPGVSAAASDPAEVTGNDSLCGV